jgi:hypothetical protein
MFGRRAKLGNKNALFFFVGGEKRHQKKERLAGFSFCLFLSASA